MAELVTGEAVALDIRVARLASRTCALLIDVMFQFMALNLLLYLTAATVVIADEAWGIGLGIVATAGVLVGYPCAFETLSRGRTLGKLALGLRVVADDGGPVRFRQALVRALASVVEIWVFSGAPALIASLFNRRGKRLGDMFAGTVVIQERVPAAAFFGPVAMTPPQLADWARGLELSRIPDGLALTARQYLARFWELRPDVRDSLGRRIADQVTALISPPPPPGVRPEIVLSAVLAERRMREERRLEQRRRRRMRPSPAAAASATATAPATGGPVPPNVPPPPGAPAPGRPQFPPPPGPGPHAWAPGGPSHPRRGSP